MTFPQNWNQTYTFLPFLFSEAQTNKQKDMCQEVQAELGLDGGQPPAGGSKGVIAILELKSQLYSSLNKGGR